MHAIELIAGAVDDKYVPDLPERPQPGICCVLGKHCNTIAKKHLIGSSFNDVQYLARPDSGRVAVAVWRAWMFGWRADESKKRDKKPERMSSWLCTEQEFVLLSRRDVRARVFDPPDTTFVGYATTSYKKHGSLMAPVNAPGKNVWLWETRKVDCTDLGRVNHWWQRLRKAQDAGVPRPVLEHLDANPALIRNVGMHVWMEFEAWAALRLHSALYQFLCYLLPSKEELKQCAL